ncbi:MAG: lysophospholipid acyltransferase family protein [Chloroflexi bacterium]|nr:lysophospholipid acyltransferase family protein [Chloroflexota bacterium]
MSYSDGRAPEANLFISWLARFIFWVVGWKVTGKVPNFPKMLLIGVPHTSNWDGAIFYVFSLAIRTHIKFIGKHTLFKFPFGGLMRFAGGIPVNRSTTLNAVDQIVDQFNQHERMAVIVAPEGTRSLTKHWKTGFYYIALKAQVPIVLGYVDYSRKEVGLGPNFMPTGNIVEDFKIIQAFYADKVGRHPEKQGPVVLPPRELANK